MDDSASALAAKQMADYSRSGIFPALVLLLTIPLATIISVSFPVNGLPELATESHALSFGGEALIWGQLAVAVAMVFIFCEIGKRLDFASHYRLLAGLAFVGALIGNLPGFYLYTANWPGAYVWQSGFGYVQSFGLPEPSSVIELLTSAVSAFMIPLAGMATAYFRFQHATVSDSQTDSTADSKTRFPLPVFSIALVISLIVYPVTEIVYRALPLQPHAPFQTPNLMTEMIPGYVGFLVYPVLFLGGFYLIGRKLDPSEDGITRFGAALFLGAIIGLFLGTFLGDYIANPSTISGFLARINLSDTFVFLVSNGILVAILGFAATSLGFAAAHGARSRNLSPQ
jgi:hypothetical protein